MGAGGVCMYVCVRARDKRESLQHESITGKGTISLSLSSESELGL